MGIALTFVHIGLLSAILWIAWLKVRALRRCYWPAATVKILAGIGVGLLYTYYYPVADTFVYFQDAGVLASQARRDFPAYLATLLGPESGDLSLTLGDPRAIFLSKITSVFHLITAGNYWVTSAYFSLVCFFSSWRLVAIVRANIPTVSSAAVVAFLFFPSFVFWTSGVLKETLAVAALLWLTGIFLKVWFAGRTDWSDAITGVLAFWILWNLKYYYAGIFIPVTATALAYRFIIRRWFSFSPAISGLVWLAIFALPLVIVSLFHPNFYFSRLPEVMVSNNEAYMSLSDPGDVVEFSDLRPTPVSIVLNSPLALFSGLFRPQFWDAGSVIQSIAAVENSLLLVFFLVSLYGARRLPHSAHRLLLWSGMIYVMLLCVLITISAPNFGTLSRYRAGYISFFAWIILCDNPLALRAERWIRGLASR